jgi:glycosyltransferase involved in cell wall biosynthesis
MKISMIMMSFLDDYPNARTNSIPKFKRAVYSFINQDYEDKELIIVADGCDVTKHIYEKYFSQHDNITLLWAEKSKNRWPGKLRQLGVDYCDGDYIAYLDADDVIMPDHIDRIVKNIKDSNYSKFLLNTGGSIPIIIHEPYKYEQTGRIDITDTFHVTKESIEAAKSTGRAYTLQLPLYGELTMLKINFEDPSGTHLIIHSKDIKTRWQSIDTPMGGEDKLFIETLKKEYEPFIYKEYTYIVCHSKMKGHDV